MSPLTLAVELPAPDALVLWPTASAGEHGAKRSPSSPLASSTRGERARVFRPSARTTPRVDLVSRRRLSCPSRHRASHPSLTAATRSCRGCLSPPRLRFFLLLKMRFVPPSRAPPSVSISALARRPLRRPPPPLSHSPPSLLPAWLGGERGRSTCSCRETHLPRGSRRRSSTPASVAMSLSNISVVPGNRERRALAHLAFREVDF